MLIRYGVAMLGGYRGVGKVSQCRLVETDQSQRG